MEDRHSLLKRQLNRYFGDPKSISGEWQGFIDLVNDAYCQFDTDREMLERSLDLSSQELIKSNSDMRAVFERIISSSVDGIFAYDLQYQSTVWNPGMERISNVLWEDAINRDIFEIFPEFQNKGDDRCLRDSIHGKTTLAKENTYLVKKTGKQGFFESHFLPLKTKSGEIIGGLGIIRDITERRMAEEALAERSIRDTLTDLYNRRYFDSRVPKEISRAHREKRQIALLLCDLDQFKKLNEERGYKFGDKVIKDVAKSIQDSIRGIDLVFRWGEDEIAVVMFYKTREDVITLAGRIRKRIKKVGETGRFDLDVSIGISLYPEHGENLDELRRLADRALYIAKKRGHKIHVGEEEYRLDEQVVQAAFQPIVDVISDHIIGYEALARDPKGKHTAYEIFKKYESIGQLVKLKKICLYKQLQVAEKIGLRRVFVNVDFELLDQLESLKKPNGIDVILEISEKEALYEVKNHLRSARKWRRRGFRFAIDDFGAGFISLPFVAELHPDYIKLDRSTVLEAVTSSKFRRFLNFLVMGLQDLSKKGVIAEGIEKENELEVMKKMGVHLAQGFLLGKPQVKE